MPLPEPSEEQSLVLENIVDSNIICDSVAGSGKTTTIMLIASHFPQHKILSLTYNKHLKFAGRTGNIVNGIHNVHVHTFHSFANNHYDQKISTDKGLEDLLSASQPKNPFKPFGFTMLIIDEAQDLKILFWKLIRLIHRDSLEVISKIVVVGDVRQTIFEYQGASNLFLLKSQEHFGDLTTTSKWTQLNLHQTWRVPKEICHFINHCLLKQDLLQSTKSTRKPLYYVCQIYKDPYHIFVKIMEEHKYAPDDVFILAPSVKSQKNTPTRHLQNMITERNDLLRKQGKEDLVWNIYNAGDDNSRTDQDELSNKIVISSFHKVKGLERKCVFLFGANEGAFQVFKNDDRTCLPNAHYVAMTRPKEFLVLINDHMCRPFRFQSEDFKEYVEYHDLVKTKPRYTENPRETQRKFGVLNLMEHQNNELLYKCQNMFKTIQLCEASDKIKIPIKIKNNKQKTVEDVSDINGVAIISYFQYQLQQKLTIWDKVDEKLYLTTQARDESIEDRFKAFEYPSFPVVETIICPKNLLYLSNYYCARMNSLTYKLDQVRNNDWISKDLFEQCSDRLNRLISKNSVFEENFEINIDIGEGLVDQYTILGSIDCIDYDNKILYEFKCTQELKDPENFLQLAIYAYAWKIRKPDEIWRFLLVNVLDDEQWEIQFNLDNMKEMIKLLVQGKTIKKKPNSSQEFTQNITQARQLTQAYSQLTQTQSTHVSSVIQENLVQKRPRSEDPDSAEEERYSKFEKIQDDDDSCL